MADFDNELLAYAMALGSRFELVEPLPGKAKKTALKKLPLVVRSVSDGVERDHSDEVAHFMARLFVDRAVQIKKKPLDKSRFEWILSDGRSDAQIRFDAPAESEVRALMIEASKYLVANGLGAVEAANQRLVLRQRDNNRNVIANRMAEKKWPPPEGTAAARALALAKDGDHFWSSRQVTQSFGWNQSKRTSAAAFIAKLKDRSLWVQEIEEHPHDSLKGKEWNIEPSDVVAVVSFCAVDDARGQPISCYQWIAKSGAK
jgi:hypothetical protein